MGWGGLSGSSLEEQRIAAWEKERKKQIKEVEDEYENYAQLRAQRLSLAYARGQNECLALCAAIHNALAREIRDMIYDHLIPPRRQHHVFEALDEHGQPRISTNPLVSVSFFDPRSRMPDTVSRRSDVWKYREYTGPIVAREIAERWYHTGLFILDVEDCLIPKFLTTDVWEHDAVPAEAVRHLKINVRSTHSDRHKLPTDQEESLRALEMVENRATEISFQLSWWSRSRPFPLLPLLAMVRPSVRRLRDMGYRNVVVRQGCVTDVPADLTHLLYGLKRVPDG